MAARAAAARPAAAAALRHRRAAAARAAPTGREPAPRVLPLLDPAASDPLPALPSWDAVLVLGGGLTPVGGLPPWVERRLDLAAALRAAAPRPPPLVLLGAGTPHKPPPPCEITKRPLTEATAGARHLIKQGVPAAAILKETQSFDTVGNALFGLTTHAAPRGWGSLAVVTSAFHMVRARALFGAVFGLASPAFRPGLSPYALAYYAASDDGVASAEALAARREREEASIATFEAATASLDSLAAFHAWVHATHLCYATARQDEFGAGAEGEANAGVDPRALETY